MAEFSFDKIPVGLADKPQQVALFETIKADLESAISHYKALAVDGISLSDVWDIVTSAVATFVKIASEVDSAGSDKKAVVLAVAETFYDNVLAPLDIPYVPNIIESRIVDPALKRLYLLLISGAIDAVVKIFNRTGWQVSRSVGSTKFEPF